MTNLAVDFYGARPAPQAIKAAGYTAVLRYLRNLSAAEAQSYLAAGLGVGTIFETLANESLGGATSGVADGRQAAEQMAAIGQPAGTLHTVNLADFAPAPGDLAAIEDYWHAYQAETSGWHVVPYGTGWLLEQMGQPGWQNAMNNNGTPGNVVVSQAVIYQRTQPTRPQIAGTQPGDYDEDVLLTTLPFWGLAAPQPQPTPPPAVDPIPLGDTVQAIAFSCKTNAAGWMAVGVTLPAGKTKDNVVGVPMDCGSPYDGTWAFASASVDFQPNEPGTCRVIVKGDPNHFFTGRVVVA